MSLQFLLCLHTRYRMLVLKLRCILESLGAFRRTQHAQAATQVPIPVALGEAQALELELLRCFQWTARSEDYCSALTASQHTGRNPRSLLWPTKPYVINLSSLSLIPCSPHSRHRSLFAVLKHVNQILMSGNLPLLGFLLECSSPRHLHVLPPYAIQVSAQMSPPQRSPP